MTVILTATVMRGAATATTLGVCLPVIAVAIIAAVVTLSVSAWATGTMPSLGTAYAIPCWGVVLSLARFFGPIVSSHREKSDG